jgi:hypothetical protein
MAMMLNNKPCRICRPRLKPTLKHRKLHLSLECKRCRCRAQIGCPEDPAQGSDRVQVAAALHQMRRELEEIKAQATLGFKTDDQAVPQKS